jgi:hypothetical protein
MRAALAKVVDDFGQNLQHMPLRAGVRNPKAPLQERGAGVDQYR